MGGRFIASAWDPHYIIGQIVCMQSMFYFVLGLLLIAFDMSFGIPFSLDQVFLPYSASNHVEFIFKWVTISAYLVAALVWIWTISWWLTMVGCAFITSFIGEFLCMKKELQEIPISSRARDPTP